MLKCAISRTVSVTSALYVTLQLGMAQDDSKGPNNGRASAIRNMLSQHMLAMRGATGPQGMTGMPGSIVSRSNNHEYNLTDPVSWIFTFNFLFQLEKPGMYRYLALKYFVLKYIILEMVVRPDIY